MTVRSICLLLFLTTLSIGQEKGDMKPNAKPDAKGESAEDRLLQAELLEVSTGDLKKALEIYNAIQTDKSTREPTRARVLLYMARCHRKLGQLEKARSLLEALVKNQAAEREVVRRAQSFLSELTGARAENPCARRRGALFVWRGHRRFEPSKGLQRQRGGAALEEGARDRPLSRPQP